MSSNPKKSRDHKKTFNSFMQQASVELEQHLNILNQWRENQTDTFVLTPVRHSLQAIHHQAVELKCITLASILEQIIDIIDKLLNSSLKPDMQVYAYLLFAMDECSSLLLKLDTNQTCALIHELEASYHDLLKQVAQSNDIIEPIIPIEIFHEELLEIIEELEQFDSLALQDKEQAIGQTNRALHTLKGSARLVGFKPLGDFIHQVEDKVQECPFEESRQLIKTLVLWLRQNESKVLNKINLKPDLNSLQSVVETKDSMTFVSPESPQVIEAKDRLRVSLSQIEQFSHLAATTNITRAYIEQQQVALKGYTQVFFDMISKLDEQTRALQLQADAALISPQAEQIKHEFDSLEMDRYSKLQHHVREIHDLHARLFGLHDDMDQTINDLNERLREQYHAAHALEEGLTHIRMISFDSILPRLESMVSQISSELNKEVKFEVTMAQGELDRSVLDKLITPLEHMLRNAIDHGIESSEQRLKIGKPRFGTLKISMQRKGANVNMTLSDDGAGIDLDSVARRAKSENWWVGENEPTQRDLIKMILQPGFTTRDETTVVSGRGVGMDIVYAQIRKLGGSLKVHTQKDEGTQFIIQLPFTSSLNTALIFQNASQYYGILTANITAITRVAIQDLEAMYDNNKIFEYMGKKFPLYYSGELLGQAHFKERIFQKKALPIILIETQDNMFALIIDKVIGPREVLLKSLGPQMQSISEILGGGVLGDGTIILMLDPLGITENDIMVSDAMFTQDHLSNHVAKIMVVDDSMTVRKVTTKLLERHHYNVLSAKDGQHALEQLNHFIPDCILLDLEMPRMDGYAFLEVLAKDKILKEIPVIVISSRSLDKYKKRAYQMGANCFLSKPFQEESLISLIENTLRQIDD